MDLSVTARTDNPAPSAPPALHKTEQRAEAIHIHPNDSVEQIARTLITVSFRQASMKYRPDHGGSHELMTRILDARSLLLNALRRY